MARPPRSLPPVTVAGKAESAGSAPLRLPAPLRYSSGYSVEPALPSGK